LVLRKLVVEQEQYIFNVCVYEAHIENYVPYYCNNIEGLIVLSCSPSVSHCIKAIENCWVEVL
jgi:hypothetical protein